MASTPTATLPVYANGCFPGKTGLFGFLPAFIPKKNPGEDK